MHRDLKLDNILVVDFDDENIDVKIADLGMADVLPVDGDMLFQRCGSPGYMAPEILRN